MKLVDAVDGWNDELNAGLYAEFTRNFPMYADTSRDLAARAAVTGDQLVVDLCGGAGATASVLLDLLSEAGCVISVDNAAAMQDTGRRLVTDRRVSWITTAAETVDQHVTSQVDAVVCNSAIWKTRTPATFAAVKRILRPGGRFTFNIAGEFAGVEHRGGPGDTLDTLIDSIAASDYGYVPDPQPPRELLTSAVVGDQLTQAGFTVTDVATLTRYRTMAEKRAWLSIPLFAQPPGQLTHGQRMEILARAYSQVDTTQPDVTTWLTVTAQA